MDICLYDITGDSKKLVKVLFDRLMLSLVNMVAKDVVSVKQVGV